MSHLKHYILVAELSGGGGADVCTVYVCTSNVCAFSQIHIQKIIYQICGIYIYIYIDYIYIYIYIYI